MPALAVPFEPAAVAPAAFSAGAAAGVAAQPGSARSIKLAPLVTLTGISPASVTTTVNDFTLTVYGTGFTAPVFGPTPQPGTMVRLATPAGAPVLPTTFVSPTQLSVLVPGFGTALTRGSLARLALLSQMTEQAITAYLNSTGGMFCSFADVACPGSSGGTVTDSTGLSGDWRYIETLYRMGMSMTVACLDINDGQRRFCPTKSANLLETPGSFPASANTVVNIGSPLVTTSNTVDLAVLPFTPVRPVPTLSFAMFVAMLAAMAAAGVLALRRQRHG